MFRGFLRNHSTATLRAIDTEHLKVSPAAHWHAKVLGISLKGIKGTGPKGHIVKSDILNFQPQQIKSELVELSFLLEISSKPSDQLIKKCTETIGKISSFEVDYKSLPEIGLLQFQLKSTNNDKHFDSEKVKQLLKIYLNDSSHLLL